VEVGIIDYFGESEDVIQAPESVGLRERFSVTVNTYGTLCYSAASMSIERDGGAVVFMPFDREDVAHPCRPALIHIPHTAEIELSTAGKQTLTIRGRQVDQQDDILIELTQEIVVE